LTASTRPSKLKESFRGVWEDLHVRRPVSANAPAGDLLFIALLVFGPKKLPDLGKGIGEGIRALKEGMKEKPSDPVNPPNSDVKS
jgi:TatA/E family protein of Tat protein translocase